MYAGRGFLAPYTNFCRYRAIIYRVNSNNSEIKHIIYDKSITSANEITLPSSYIRNIFLHFNVTKYVLNNSITKLPKHISLLCKAGNQIKLKLNLPCTLN